MDTDQGSELDSEDEINKGGQWNDFDCDTDESFTLNLKVYENEVYKDDSSTTDLVIASNDHAPEICDGGRKKRNTGISFCDEIPVVFEEMEDEIERQLDAKAAKSNLSVINVKNILKSVITNEDVMAMVRHSMLNEDDGSWLTYEPKLTRSKAKELMKSQPEITLPLLTPTKKQSECQILIEKELSEDSSDDDEYKPVEDETEQSEDEKSSVADSLSSPVRKVTTPTLPLTSEVGSMDFRDEDTVTNVECGTQTCWTDDGLFKIPQVRQEATEKPEENIGQRTRSKLCLNNTPLEVIESAFVPPDITTDMYDSECDDEDWTAFLKDFATNNGDNENVEDDDAGDPEYNVLADLDQTVDKEELRVDKAVKISRKEKKVLMAEAYEPLFSDDDDFDLLQFFPSVDNTDTQAPPNLPQESSNLDQHWATSHPDKTTSGRGTLMVVGNEEPRDEAVGKATCSEPSSVPPSSNEDPIPEISATQRAILRQQMRQHVQLLSQNFLQLYCHPYLSKYAICFKSLLVNLRCLSLFKEGSHFEAENLKSAIDLVIEWEKLMDTNPDTKIEMQNFIKKEIEKGDYLKKKHVRHRERLPPRLMDFMANSKVFVYPLLLPMVAFRRDNRGEHCSYLPSEEQLIAIGMEQFVPYVESMKDIRKREVLDKVVCMLHQLLLPLRTCVYTKNYIMNAKSHDRKGGAIPYYLRNNKAPETYHYVFPVDWEKSVCPKQVPKRNLPENWARHIYGFTKEEEGFLRFKRRKTKHKWWGKQFAIPVLLIGDFPDFQTAKEFGQGTLDYTKLSGKVFRMLPSMPLISNITKDIVEHTSNDEDLPKVVFTVGTVHRGTQTKHPGTPMSLPVLTSPVIGSSKKTSPLKTVTPILKKYNSHRKGKGGTLMKSISPSGEKGNESSPGKSSPRNIAPKPMVVFVPSEKLNLPELVTTDAIDASNASSQETTNVGVSQTISDSSVVDGVEISPIIPEISPSSCGSVSQTRVVVNEAQQTHSKHEGSTKETEKKDNEDELAALMIASSTIRGPTANLERKRKSKQQRDTDAKLALLSPEKGSATEERDYIFAHAFFKKLEERLKNGTEEGCSSFENLVHILNELAEEKPSHEVENLLKRILQILGPHKDLVEEFSCFLNSKQALHQGCLASHLSGIQMRDFIHKLEVYFAKQPNHVHKIIQAISDLSTRPCITLEEIKEEIVPLLKGNLILLHKLLQLLPTERPLASLMTDFEELEFVEDLDLNIDMEPVENVRLPEKDLEDRFGGEGCECPCHSSTPSSVPSGEKESTRTSHCNRCGLKFVNGRVVLQTAKGIRPAKVTFDSPADFQRVVVKDVVQPPRLNKGRSRKKNKLSESKDESLSPPPKIRIIHCTAESEDDALATRVSDLTSSPRTTQSRAGGKGARSASSKGKDAKSTSTQQKNSLLEASQLPGDSEIALKLNVNGTSDSKDLPSVSASNKSSSEGEPKVVMDSNLQSLGKVIDGGDSSSQDLESQTISEECSSTISESSTKVDSSNPADESGGANADGIPWTREEDRIILQTFKADGGKSDALVKIRQKLPERSVDEIVSRFQELMSLFRKMTVPTATGEEEDIVMEKRMSDEN